MPYRHAAEINSSRIPTRLVALLIAATGCGIPPDRVDSEVAARAPSSEPAVDSSSLKSQGIAVDPRTIQALDDLALARRLIAHGRSKGSIESLVSGAYILRRVPLALPSEQDNRVQFSGSSSQAPRPESEDQLNPSWILNQARELAQGDSSRLALIERVDSLRVPGVRGATGGPVRRAARVGPATRSTWSVSFRADEIAAVRVIGDGSTDLDVIVFDPSGSVVADDLEHGDDCFVVWNPSDDATFHFVIENRGGTENTFWLLSN